MADRIGDQDWVWVMVQNPGGREEIVGFQDDSARFSYIPMFSEKETALQCFLNMKRTPDKKVEAQAILFEDLRQHAADGGFLVLHLDADGKILNTIDPTSEQ